MYKLYYFFKQKFLFFAVIHSRGSMAEDFRNAEIAKSSGANGVFFINHGCSADRIFAIAEEFKARDPDYFVGVNLLGTTVVRAIDYLAESSGIPLDALWHDDGGIYCVDGELDVTDAVENADYLALLSSKWSGVYFGSVAFKTHGPVKEMRTLLSMAFEANTLIDVPTTSGPGTGIAADVTKIQTMRQAIGSLAPLAVASGITPENVHEYMPHATVFLAATGVNQGDGKGENFYRLDGAKVSKLMEVLRVANGH